MICKNCGKDFHYCPSCGEYPEAELGYCRNECVIEDFQKMSLEDKIELLIEPFHMERLSVMQQFKEFIIENKEEFGKRLVDYIFEQA